MQPLFYHGGSTLFIGAESQHQGTVAHELAFDALSRGSVVCLLCDAEKDLTAAQARYVQWCRGRDHDPVHIESIAGLPNYRQWHEPDELADQIEKAVKRHSRNELIVFEDRSVETLAAWPGDHRIGLLAELPGILPNCSTVCAAHTGSTRLPPMQLGDLRKYRADRAWKVQANNGGIVTLTEIRPAETTVKVSLKTARGGVLLVEEMETENV